MAEILKRAGEVILLALDKLPETEKAIFLKLAEEITEASGVKQGG